MAKAVIFNIQKFCVHDGPGIRTTLFFKGCPLRCLWCHNPESQQFCPEMLYNREKCTLCGQCGQHCPQGAIKINGGTYLYDRTRCVSCGTCIDFCIHNAREIAGQAYTINQLLTEIEKDRPFYEQSGGGVTFSGGEALSQIQPVEELAKACRTRDISVAVDTCGQVPFDHLTRVLPYVDIFLYDLKLIDPVLHEKYTGQDNRLILANLKQLAARDVRIFLRLPLIDGINTGDEQINGVINFIRDMNIEQINLLPYHNTGLAKYARLNRSDQSHDLAAPSGERLAEIKALFEHNLFRVKIGG